MFIVYLKEVSFSEPFVLASMTPQVVMPVPFETHLVQALIMCKDRVFDKPVGDNTTGNQAMNLLLSEHLRNKSVISIPAFDSHGND